MKNVIKVLDKELERLIARDIFLDRQIKGCYDELANLNESKRNVQKTIDEIQTVVSNLEEDEC